MAGRRRQQLQHLAAALDVPLRDVQNDPPGKGNQAAAVAGAAGKLRRADHGVVGSAGGELRAADRMVGPARQRDLLVSVSARNQRFISRSGRSSIAAWLL